MRQVARAAAGGELLESDFEKDIHDAAADVSISNWKREHRHLPLSGVDVKSYKSATRAVRYSGC